jgi:hypothetical protein
MNQICNCTKCQLLTHSLLPNKLIKQVTFYTNGDVKIIYASPLMLDRDLANTLIKHKENHESN